MSSKKQTVYRITERKGIDYLKDFQEDIPNTNQHEVLIKIHAVSLNYHHVIPCSDSAEEILEVGDQVIGFKKGDRVISNFDPTSVKTAYQYLQSQVHMGKICIKVD